MTIEPGIAGMIATPGALVDWSAYQKCRICRAEQGQPCTSVSARVTGNRPEGGPHQLPVAHGHRRRRSGR